MNAKAEMKYEQSIQYLKGNNDDDGWTTKEHVMKPISKVSAQEEFNLRIKTKFECFI